MVKSRYTAFCVVAIPAGIAFLFFGIYKIISHLILMKKKHIVVVGKIVAFEKEVHHSRYGTKILWFPCLQFDFEGHTYAVRDPYGLSELEKDGFERYVGDSTEIYIPGDDPYSAMLNYERSLRTPYKNGAKYVAIGAFLLFLAALIIFSM